MRPLLVTASPADGRQNASVPCLRMYERISLCDLF